MMTQGVVEPPEGTRLVLVSIDLLGQWGTRTAGCDLITAEWGEPDEHGWYTPTFTVHSDDNPFRAAADAAERMRLRAIEAETRLAEARAALRKAIVDLPQPTLGLAGGVNRGAVIDAIEWALSSGQEPRTDGVS